MIRVFVDLFLNPDPSLTGRKETKCVQGDMKIFGQDHVLYVYVYIERVFVVKIKYHIHYRDFKSSPREPSF